MNFKIERTRRIQDELDFLLNYQPYEDKTNE